MLKVGPTILFAPTLCVPPVWLLCFFVYIYIYNLVAVFSINPQVCWILGEFAGVWRSFFVLAEFVGF